jgi:predicted transcriptional regulator
MIKVAVTIDPETLRRVDASARRRKESRSRYVNEALVASLRAEDEAAIQARIDRVFRDRTARDEQRRTSEQFLAVAGVREEEDPW